MATARSSANVGSSGSIEIIISSGTQSSSNNTTRVRVRGIMHNSSGRSFDNSSDGVVRRISGENSWSGRFNYDLSSNQSYTFIDQTFTVPHNSNGTKTVSYTITLGSSLSGTFGSGGSVGTSLTLPRITRIPGAPGIPNITPVSPGIVSASWGAASNNGSAILEYQIVWSRFSNFRSIDTLRDSTSLSRTIPGLNVLTDYWFRVRARNAHGWGPWSSSRQHYTVTTPASGGPVSLSHSTGTTINASWGEPGNGGRLITNYQLQVADNPNFTDHSVFNKGTTRSHTITGASMGKTWYVRVRAQNDQGWGNWGPTRSFAVPNTPAQVGALSIVYNPPTTIDVSWTAPNNRGAPITEYQVQYSKSPSFSIDTPVENTSSRSLKLEDLDIGDTYYIRARARNKQGWGDWSATFSQLVVSGPLIRHNGVWRNSIAYVRHNGVWRIATPFVRHNGVWRIGGG